MANGVDMVINAKHAEREQNHMQRSENVAPVTTRTQRWVGMK
jgi:hypothetical protein